MNWLCTGMDPARSEGIFYSLVIINYSMLSTRHTTHLHKNTKNIFIRFLSSLRTPYCPHPRVSPVYVTARDNPPPHSADDWLRSFRSISCHLKQRTQVFFFPGERYAHAMTFRFHPPRIRAIKKETIFFVRAPIPSQKRGI